MTIVKFEPIGDWICWLYRVSTFSLELNRVFSVKTAEIEERSVRCGSSERQNLVLQLLEPLGVCGQTPTANLCGFDIEFKSGKDAMITTNRKPLRLTCCWIATSAAVATMIGQLFACWWNLCGSSLSSVAALVTGISAGVLLQRWIGTLIPPHPIDGRQFGLLRYGFASALVMLSWSLPVLLNATLLAGCETIGSSWPGAVMLTMLFPALVAVVVTAVAGLFFQTAGVDGNVAWSDSVLAGTPGIVALLIPVWLGLPELPLAELTTLMAGVSLLSGALLFSTLPTPSQQSRSIELLAATKHGNRSNDGRLAFVAVGLLLVAIAEVMCRLMPCSLPVLIQTAGITSLMLSILTRPLARRLLTSRGMQVIWILALASLPVLFDSLAGLNLVLNSSGLSPFLVLLLRSVQCSVFAAAAILPAVCLTFENCRAASSQATVLSQTIGLLLAVAAVSYGSSVLVLLAAGMVLHATGQVLQILTETRGSVIAMGGRATVRACFLPALCFMCAMMAGFGSIDTARTSSLLFSERTAAAIQKGVRRDLIAQSQVNRLISCVQTSVGEVTVWRRAGKVLEFQRNGVPTGRVSTDTSVSPQPPEEFLPAVFGLASHPHPARVLLLGDDTGVCLRTCSHFPVQEIVAVRSDRRITDLARRFTWSGQQLPSDLDERVQLLHEPSMIALSRRELKKFEVVIVAGESLASPSAASLYSTEFYQAAHSRMTTDGVFCQRFSQSGLGPDAIKTAAATMMGVFKNVGVIQTVPGQMLFFASDAEAGLIDPELLSRLQREHVRQEIATSGWDWAQVALLPFLDARDPIGLFSREKPPQAATALNCKLAMSTPYETSRMAEKQAELNAAFAPHQQQILAVLRSSEDHEEVQRRMSALSQQLEILAGMPDVPWTYRKSLQMEMKQSPRAPLDSVKAGEVTKVAHPLDLLRQRYFITLGKALTAASRSELSLPLINELDTFTETFEPLITHFAHYEIVRLHELSNHPSPAEEFRHRLHIVFFTSPTDASVRPVVAAMEQLVNQPSLIADDTERYDMLNSLLQKLTERWEARTAWEPRSSLRVQNDVDMSVSVANRAMAQMEGVCSSSDPEKSDFYRRRRFVNAALIGPLREYRDQVLAHRMKSEKPAEQNTEDANDLPLMIDSGSGLNTN